MEIFFKKIIFSIIILSSYVAKAEEYTFRVLASEGNNLQYVSDKQKPLLTGQLINACDSISCDVFLMLAHKNGTIVEINPGTTKSLQSLKKEATSSSSATNDYVNFLANKLDENEGTAYTSRMRNTGAVSRAGNEAEIHVYFPSIFKIYSDSIMVFWRDTSSNSHKIYIKNMFEQELYSFKAKDTSSVSLNLASPELSATWEQQRMLVLIVEDTLNKNRTSFKHTLMKLDAKTKQTMDLEVEKITQNTTNNETAKFLLLANYFESKGFLVDAMSYYIMLQKANPKVKDFKDMFHEFIRSHEL